MDINEEFWQYLGFSVGEGSDRRYFVFRVLPFGLATACYVFTKLLRPLVKRWRSHGLRAIVYIDDGICAASTEAESKAACDFIVEDLRRAGFILNLEKSALEPTQIGRWLGFTIYLDSGAFLVPEEKISKLRSSVTSMVAAGSCSAQQLASVVG